jgi:phosphate transport system substrate-binding protein
VVAEKFGKTTKFKTPKVESTGSGGGIKLFCAGVGEEHPDIANSSRRIKQSEVDKCYANGVTEIVEIKIGFDGIVLANVKHNTKLSLSLQDIYLALAKTIPDSNNTMILNSYQTWNSVNSTLPNQKIEVLGPPPTSGTRDAFVELAMEGGCMEIPAIAALKKSDEKDFKAKCMTMREDGAYVEAGENDNLIVQKLIANPNALGIFGFSFLEENKDKIQGAMVNGVIPSFDAIADGSYPLSRPLFFYVKKQHLATVRGIKEYVKEFVSDKASGEFGYLAKRGLIPLPTAERKQVVRTAKNMTILQSL